MSESEIGGNSFVVWLDSREEEACAGRVEHVSTSRREVFATAEELIAFLLRSREEQE